MGQKRRSSKLQSQNYTQFNSGDRRSVWPDDGAPTSSKRKATTTRRLRITTRALEISPKVRVESSRADAYLKKGDIDRAIADYTTAIQRDARAGLLTMGAPIRT